MDDRQFSLGADLAGVWTRWAARSAGVTTDSARSRLERGEWQQLRRGTYADGGVTPDAFMRASAAVQSACTVRRFAVAAGRTAARVYGETTAGTLHSRQLLLGPADVCLLRGVPVLSLPRTLVDLAEVLRPDALVCALDHVLHHQRVSRADLDALAASRAGWPGIVAFRTAVSLTDELAESPHETLTRLVLKPVLPGLRSQVRVLDRRREIVARLDLGDETLRLGVESDGAAYHRGRAALDRQRDDRTGWTIERCSWFETRCRPDQLRARVLRTAARLG